MLDLATHDPTALIVAYGYWAVMLFAAVESMGVPVPGEAMLLCAAIYAGTTHQLHIGLVIACAAAGAVLGDNAGYLVGRAGGYRLVHRFGLDGKMRLGQYLFDQHGGKAVFFGRFVAVLRIWAAFLAGMHRMPWRRFLLYNAAGGIVWSTLMGSLAYGLGSAVLRLGGVIGAFSAAAAVLVMLLVMLALRRSEQRWERESRCPKAAQGMAA